MIEHPKYCLLAANFDPERPTEWVYFRIEKMPLEKAIKELPEAYSHAIARIIPLFVSNDPTDLYLSSDRSKKIVVIEKSKNCQYFLCDSIKKVNAVIKNHQKTSTRIDVLKYLYQYYENAIEA